ncbi:hypothetical protein K2173_024808 [Erythroxylum novogranatense]|uniref:Annexin n=1 Tax=Erythroxylum novogranatense TaxID=1862640 RepID=A0AAV8UCM7_9ROSI|nr:hypothetical protein K2173_024808 [Erythroxylum novogranatense]
MATLWLLDDVPSPTQDSETLRKAVQGFGTDEEAIILTLGRRNASQRREIREKYQQLYKEHLIDRLYSELSGDFRKAVMLWTYDPPERDAILANETLRARRKGPKELQVIVEIACASSPHHLMAVRQAYCSRFDGSIEEDIASLVPLPLKKILVGLVSSFRYDKELVNADVANSEAEILHNAIKMKQLDNDDLVYVLSTRSFSQIRATFKSYEQRFGNHIHEDIKASGNGTLESLLGVVIWCIDTPEKHFAEVIRTSILGLGTDEDSLTRAIVTRAEIDLKKVRAEYLKMYKSSLDNDVTGDTSGDYRRFLMTLLGSKR